MQDPRRRAVDRVREPLPTHVDATPQLPTEYHAGPGRRSGSARAGTAGDRPGGDRRSPSPAAGVDIRYQPHGGPRPGDGRHRPRPRQPVGGAGPPRPRRGPVPGPGFRWRAPRDPARRRAASRRGPAGGADRQEGPVPVYRRHGHRVAATGSASRTHVARRLRHDPLHRGRWPAVTARAVTSLPELVELAFPLLVSGGRLVAWKRGDLRDEVGAAAIAMRALGGGRIESREVAVRRAGGAPPRRRDPPRSRARRLPARSGRPEAPALVSRSVGRYPGATIADGPAATLSRDARRGPLGHPQQPRGPGCGPRPRRRGGRGLAPGRHRGLRSGPGRGRRPTRGGRGDRGPRQPRRGGPGRSGDRVVQRGRPGGGGVDP